MSDFWKGYANVNDDVRHTYEQVFFGRNTTANLDASDVPGMQQPAPNVTIDNSTTNNTTNIYGQDNPHAELYASIWGNGGDAPGVAASGPEIGPGPTPGGAAAQVEALPIEAPKIEAPAPSQGNDMTPGY